MSWQPSLLEPAPKRKLRTEHRCWWGVDPSTVRVSLGVVRDDVPPVAVTGSLPGLAGARRLEAAYSESRILAERTALEAPPGIVVVEQPSGTHQNLELAYVVGAIMGGLWAGLGLAGMFPHFETVPAPKWKKELLGYGGIKKPKPAEVRAGATYAVLDWARDVCGYDGSLWDEADALAIACWARRDVLLEP